MVSRSVTSSPTPATPTAPPAAGPSRCAPQAPPSSRICTLMTAAPKAPITARSSPGGPQVIGAVEAQQPVLMHMTADDQCCWLDLEQVGETGDELLAAGTGKAVRQPFPSRA